MGRYKWTGLIMPIWFLSLRKQRLERWGISGLLVNASMKIISKVLANRLRDVLEEVIDCSQTGFLKGRSTLDSIATPQEVIQFAKQNKKLGFMLKLDFKKAYDTMEWGSILESLQTWGFSSSWVSWIRLWLQPSKVACLINGIQGREFVCKRGLRQGDPRSPLIFVLVATGLRHMISKCQKMGLVKGLGCRDETNAVINLQYADDTLIVRKDCLIQAFVLKWVLFCYER